MATLLCAAAGCARSQPIPPPGGAPPAQGAPVVVSLRTDKKTVHSKDPVKLTLTVKNPSSTPVRLTFNSGMKYDYEIRKGKAPTGEKVWQWSKGRMFIQMILDSILEPGKSIVFTESYVPGAKDGDGKPLPELTPGTYTATGILTLSGRAPRPMASTTFTVR